MWSKGKHMRENTSTPKRRRLGMGRILQPNLQIFGKENNIFQSSNTRPSSPFDKNDDPPLPCNQIGYLCDSENTSSTSSDIPCSPGILDSSMNNVEKWGESLVVSTNLTKIMNKAQESVKELEEIEDVSDEMFYSKLEVESNWCDNMSSSLLTSRCEKHFRENIEESFAAINQSIHGLNKSNGVNNRSSLFETKDSFLLDIKESGIILEDKISKYNEDINNEIHKCNNIFQVKDNFYGLPIVTKSLFKSYRNIEKLYDWQEECLNLPAIQNRENLIYALPTSGGKTLVAEVLMLREVLCRKKNALFILPFVAIVQEKIWSLSPFAVKLEFLVEEYAAGKGHIPPKKRRKKNSIYIATIEKGLALIRSLIEENRLEELGLIVVDELHLIGEPGRGATLETLLSTVLFADKGIQIVAMSATIGNLPELASFLRAEVFQREFRPVELKEYVKLGDMLHRIVWAPDRVDVLPDKQLHFDYSAAGGRLDPDRLGGLVSEVVPGGACLVFCPTQKNCENVAALLCKLLRREMLTHRSCERASLCEALRAEGSSIELQRAARCGLAYHHAGLSSDERSLLEHAFRDGVISVICCTSTLAAGVNLPASRVIIRAPRVGREHMTLAHYRQMAGRAGRAGVTERGESILIVTSAEWPKVVETFRGGLGAARSVLAPRVADLLLSAVGLRLATTRPELSQLLACTLLATCAQHDSPVDTKQMCDEALRSLQQAGAVEVVHTGRAEHAAAARGDCVLYDDSQLAVSKLGLAAIKGCMELSAARQLVCELQSASRAVVLMGGLHLLYLVTPCALNFTPDYRHYYSLYCNLDEEGIQTAKTIGITESNAIRMMTGKAITNVPEAVLSRFYLAMMLHELWRQAPLPALAHKYSMSLGMAQSVLSSACARAYSAVSVCEALELWPFRALFAELAPRLAHCAAPELQHLMELPRVKKARALQLSRAGYKRVEDIARADADELLASVPHLTRSHATHLISAARMMLIEKVENLRAEVEIVMEELNS